MIRIFSGSFVRSFSVTTDFCVRRNSFLMVIRVRFSSTVSLIGIFIIRSIFCNVSLILLSLNCWNIVSVAFLLLVDFCSFNVLVYRSFIASLLLSVGLFMLFIWVVFRLENLKSG